VPAVERLVVGLEVEPDRDLVERGAEIRFAVVDDARRPSTPLQFFGRVYGNAMEGTTGAGRRWRANRKPL